MHFIQEKILFSNERHGNYVKTFQRLMGGGGGGGGGGEDLWLMLPRPTRFRQYFRKNIHVVCLYIYNIFKVISVHVCISYNKLKKRRFQSPVSSVRS